MGYDLLLEGGRRADPASPGRPPGRQHRDVVLGIEVREQLEVVGAHGLEPAPAGERDALRGA